MEKNTSGTFSTFLRFSKLPSIANNHGAGMLKVLGNVRNLRRSGFFSRWKEVTAEKG